MNWLDWLRRVFGGGGKPPPAPPAPTPPPPPPADLLARFVAAINARRSRPVATNPQLTSSAQAWADELARRGGHPEHGDWYGRIRAAGYAGPYVSENIAAGQSSPEVAVADWMLDSPHRSTLVSPLYLDVGVGIARGVSGCVYVADFGG